MTIVGELLEIAESIDHLWSEGGRLLPVRERGREGGREGGREEGGREGGRERGRGREGERERGRGREREREQEKWCIYIGGEKSLAYCFIW